MIVQEVVQSVKFMYQGWESNPRPQVYESCALPTELPWQNYLCCGARSCAWPERLCFSVLSNYLECRTISPSHDFDRDARRVVSTGSITTSLGITLLLGFPRYSQVSLLTLLYKVAHFEPFVHCTLPRI